MINRISIILIFLTISLGLIWVGRQLRKVADRTQSFETFLPANMPQRFSFPPDTKMTDLKIQGRKVIGTVPAPDETGKRNFILMNRISPNWKQGMEKTFLAQGGSSLKAIEINRLDSFIWSTEGKSLNVETVLVSIKNDKGESTKFNAMVDSETGQIIQTWNQPVIDPLNPRENQGVPIDPRYLQN